MDEIDWTAGLPAAMTILILGVVVGLFLATIGVIKIKR